MATQKQDQYNLELLLSHFNRNEYEQKYNNNILVALKYLMIQFSKKIFASKILSVKQDLDFYKLILSKLQNKICRKKIKMLFWSSDHNFTAESFHKYCDGHGPTITIIQSNYGNIFGGYAPIKWPTEEAGLKSSGDLFLFLIKSNDNDQKCPLIFHAQQGTKRRPQSPKILNIITRGPVFGDGVSEISIGDKCNDSPLYYDSMGWCDYRTRCYTYQKTRKYDFSELNNNTLSGAPRTNVGSVQFFQVIDYEVFEINWSWLYYPCTFYKHYKHLCWNWSLFCNR